MKSNRQQNQKDRPLHLEIQNSQHNCYGVLRTTYRDQNGKVRHANHGRIFGISLNKLKLIQEILRNK